jgi:transposase
VIPLEYTTRKPR